MQNVRPDLPSGDRSRMGYGIVAQYDAEATLHDNTLQTPRGVGSFSDASVVRVVLDNLNVHVIASLYVAFPEPEARRIARKLEFHYTPKHGSWLNVAECELAVLASQCLGRRLPDVSMVRSEIAAWERQRNRERPTVAWHFTTAQARRKLKHLYPHLA